MIAAQALTSAGHLIAAMPASTGIFDLVNEKTNLAIAAVKVAATLLFLVGALRVSATAGFRPVPIALAMITAAAAIWAVWNIDLLKNRVGDEFTNTTAIVVHHNTAPDPSALLPATAFRGEQPYQG